MVRILTFLLSIFAQALCIVHAQTNTQDQLPQWQKGFLDIHHINTGRGNCTFMILPDGTTLLIDAGDLDSKEFDKKFFPLKAAPHFSNDNKSAGQTIVNFIKQVYPPAEKKEIGYALITHFHADHYGEITPNSPSSKSGKYKLSGISEVGELIPIRNLIDRGYPAYNFPVDLPAYYKGNPSFSNYLDFASYMEQHVGMKREALLPGAKDQIQLRYDRKSYPSFQIRNIKANATVWTGSGSETEDLFSKKDMLDERKKLFNENPLSLAIKISYGSFDYFTGGDNTGLKEDGFKWHDVETPMSKAVGAVEAMSLNHHGNRDATNKDFLETLSPKVVVMQSWCSDQPGQEVAFRLINQNKSKDSCHVFALYLHPEAAVYLGPWINDVLKSREGHVLIRVLPGGDKFFVYVLDDNDSLIRVKNIFGPYLSN